MIQTSWKLAKVKELLNQNTNAFIKTTCCTDIRITFLKERNIFVLVSSHVSEHIVHISVLGYSMHPGGLQKASK